MLLHSNSVTSLEQLLRNAANTEYPELKNWRFKKKHDHILAIPKDVIIIAQKNKIDEYLDYISLIEFLLDKPGQELEFTQAFITESELLKLRSFLEKRNQHVEKTPKSLVITNVPTTTRQIEGSKEGGG